MPFGFYDVHRGVRVKDVKGGKTTISYSGLLAKAGAEQVFLHYGYGDEKHWHHIDSIEMERTKGTFQKTINMDFEPLHFCFRDPLYNWDNNNGANWNIR